MKASYFVFLLILLLLIVFCSMIYMISGQAIFDCYSHVVIDMDRFKQNSSQEYWNLRKVCTDRKTVLISWLKCNQDVNNIQDLSRYVDQWLLEELSFLLPNNGNLLELKRQHNAACQIYPYLLID